MVIDDEVRAALETLRRHAQGNDFELHRIDVLERDLNNPPVVEQIDETHQRFDGVTYYKNKKGHYQAACVGIHRVIWRYYHGEIPTDDVYEVHHRNLNPADNFPDNLQLLTSSEHTRLHRSKAPTLEKVCPICGISFSTKRPEQKYCSRKCADKAHIIYDRNKTCLYCGKNFISRKDTPNQKYCSRDCAYKARTAHIEKTCPVCGKIFPLKNPGDKKKYCSISCSKKDYYEKARQQNSR